MPVTLLWEASGAPGERLHRVCPSDPQRGAGVTGFDQPPAAGRFPTKYWRPGDRSVSEFVLPLPASLAPGTYQLWAGLYPTGTQGQERVTITATDRLALNRSVLLGTVVVK